MPIDMDLYGNNSLSGFQQKKPVPQKEEHEKTLVDLVKERIRKRGTSYADNRSSAH